MTEQLPPVLANIISTGHVVDGSDQIPLHSHVAVEDGLYLQSLVEDASATRTLEIGMAYGISTLFICDVLSRKGAPARHIAIDPFQSTDWRNVGLKNVKAAGFDALVDFRESRSEFELPQLVADKTELDFALIDGWHSFDQALVEFFYIDRILRPGGIVAFDDANWPGISKLMRFILTLPHYQLQDRPALTIPPSAFGKVRRAVAQTTVGQKVLHPDMQVRTWELGIHHRCVAFRKAAADSRAMKDFKDF